jgi:hypothetical protein
MNSEQQPRLRDVWALTWRSIVFAPLMLLAFIPLLVLGVSLFALPLFGALYIYVGLPLQGVILLAVWLILVWAWRRFDVWRFYT